MTSAAGPSETGRPVDLPVADPPPSALRAQTGTDPSERDWARTRSSDATAPPPAVPEAVVEARTSPPPVASTTGAATSGSAPAGVRPAPARRSPLLVQGWAAAAAGALLVAAAAAGPLALVAAVVVLQLVLVRSVLALLDAPAPGAAFVVAAGTALAADVVVLVDDGRVDGLAPVLGLGLVAALLAQLARRRRSRVTEALADTLVGALVAASAACLLALHLRERGPDLLLPALAAAAAVLLAGRLADRLLARPALAVGSTRGWPGLVLGLLAAVGAAVAVAATAELEPRVTALLALAAAATAVAADLAVDLGAVELRAGRRDSRRAAALAPVAALLPYALLGPVALLAHRLVLG